jgi:hypothetical protein
VQDMLFQVVKELHPAQNAASRFGNLLLLLPTITVGSYYHREHGKLNLTLGFED